MATKKSSQYPYQWADGSFHSRPQTGKPFTPFSPPPIPSGYYDPNLDAQRDAASRGLTNTQQDVGLAGRRAGEDYGLDPNDPTYGYSTVGTINRNYSRDTADLTTQSQQEGEDYNRNTALLTRQYGILGGQQAEQARKYGVTSGGIALLSAAKRAENQGIDQQALDTAHQRAVAGFALGQSRLAEDKTLGLGAAQTTYNRGVADRGNVLSRAGTEDQFYGLDVNASKLYQAQQAGYVAPQGPANEHRDAAGNVYRVVTYGGKKYKIGPSGKIIGRA